jgi:hypothetical protein
MTEPLDIDSLREAFLGDVFDERPYTVDAEKCVEYALSCGEVSPRYTDLNDPDFQAPPTFPTSLQGGKRLPDGFPKLRGLGMDAGKAVTAMKPIRPGVTLTGRKHLHDVYTKTGRSGRMVFMVIRLELFDPDGVQLAAADTSIVIRERPSE